MLGTSFAQCAQRLAEIARLGQREFGGRRFAIVSVEHRHQHGRLFARMSEKREQQSIAPGRCHFSLFNRHSSLPSL
jgi:hypothetical protein